MLDYNGGLWWQCQSLCGAGVLPHKLQSRLHNKSSSANIVVNSRPSDSYGGNEHRDRERTFDTKLSFPSCLL